MARKAKKTHRRRRTGGRRMSGIGGSVVPVLSTIGGAVVGTIIYNKASGKINDKLLGGLLVGAGILGAAKLKIPMLAGVATGVAVAGGIKVLSSFGVMSGIGALEDAYQMEISGVGDFPAIGNMSNVGDVNEYEGANFLNGTEDNEGLSGIGGGLGNLAGVDGESFVMPSGEIVLAA